MGFEDAVGNIQAGRGTLYKLNDTGCFKHLDPVLPSVTVSNGLAWNDNGTRMYYIDSPTKQIALFDYDPATASICNHFTVFLLLLTLRNNYYDIVGCLRKHHRSLHTVFLTTTSLQSTQ